MDKARNFLTGSMLKMLESTNIIHSLISFTRVRFKISSLGSYVASKELISIGIIKGRIYRLVKVPSAVANSWLS